MESVTWFAVAAPAATPPGIVTAYAQEIAAILKKPDVQARLGELGLRGSGSSPEALKAFIASETRKWTEVIEKGSIGPD